MFFLAKSLVENPVTQNKRCVPIPVYFQFHFYQEQNPEKQMFYQNLFPKMKTFLPKTKLFYQNQGHGTKMKPVLPPIPSSKILLPKSKQIYQNQIFSLKSTNFN